MGVICLLLRVARSVSPYYHLNITDRRVPLTTIVETTHVVDPDAVGGHLLYMSKYVDPAHPGHDLPEARWRRTTFDMRGRSFPPCTTRRSSSKVQRARITEPVHVLGGASNVPDMFPVSGLALASTAHVYPEMVSGQSVTGWLSESFPGILARMRVEPAGGGMTASGHRGKRSTS